MCFGEQVNPTELEKELKELVEAPVRKSTFYLGSFLVNKAFLNCVQLVLVFTESTFFRFHRMVLRSGEMGYLIMCKTALAQLMMWFVFLLY